MLTPEDILVIQKMGCWALGCLTGFCFGWTARPKPKPVTPPVDVGEETMQRGERAVAAFIAFRKGELPMPDVMQ